MRYLKLLVFTMALCCGLVAQAANLIYSNSTSGTTTEVAYVSYTGAEDWIYVQPGASYTFDAVAYDDGYAEWTISVTDNTGTYVCHAWNNRYIFMSDGRDTYYAVLGNEPEIFDFYFNYVMPPMPPPPEG